MQQVSDTKPWFKERWPWILMAGPAIVIVAGIITTWLAIRSNDGLVEDDYYKQGLAVNQRLQRDHKAAELGLNANLLRSGPQLRVMLGTSNLATSMPDRLILKITHPTRAGTDQSVQLSAEGGGMFSGKLDVEISGRWHVSLEEPSGIWRLQGDWLADTLEPLRLQAEVTATSIK